MLGRVWSTVEWFGEAWIRGRVWASRCRSIVVFRPVAPYPILYWKDPRSGNTCLRKKPSGANPSLYHRFLYTTHTASTCAIIRSSFRLNPSYLYPFSLIRPWNFLYSFYPALQRISYYYLWTLLWENICGVYVHCTAYNVHVQCMYCL